MKTLIIDAICGCGFSNPAHAVMAEQQGLVRFTGNQWNVRWEFDRDELDKQPVEDLQLLYEKMRTERAEIEGWGSRTCQ